MASELKLDAENRTEFGSSACRRLRRRNRVPANVYGHGEDPCAISVSTDSVMKVIHAGQKLVDVTLASGTEKALIREIQWDAMGDHLMHFDLQRVSAGERIETEVVVETHGTAPGVVEGGVLEMALHTISVECPALKIPEKFEININAMNIGDAVHVRDLPVPEGVIIHNSPEEVVVQVTEPTATPEEEVAEPLEGEPELAEKDDTGEAEAEETDQ